MLRALASLKADWTVPVQIAMEEHMGCAMGVCLGCVVPTRKGYQRVCRDGPVFDLGELGWN
jgi:dihydroorotate dehydrogenase electron transfer subunit